MSRERTFVRCFLIAGLIAKALAAAVVCFGIGTGGPKIETRAIGETAKVSFGVAEAGLLSGLVADDSDLPVSYSFAPVSSWPESCESDHVAIDGVTSHSGIPGGLEPLTLTEIAGTSFGLDEEPEVKLDSLNDEGDYVNLETGNLINSTNCRIKVMFQAVDGSYFRSCRATYFVTVRNNDWAVASDYFEVQLVYPESVESRGKAAMADTAFLHPFSCELDISHPEALIVAPDADRYYEIRSGARQVTFTAAEDSDRIAAGYTSSHALFLPNEKCVFRTSSCPARRGFRTGCLRGCCSVQSDALGGVPDR
jgi:hypothetical protein